MAAEEGSTDWFSPKGEVARTDNYILCSKHLEPQGGVPRTTYALENLDVKQDPS